VAHPAIESVPPPAAQTGAPRPMQFPFLDLHAQFAPLREEVMRAVADVLDRQQFILGPEVEKLEREVAQRVGCEFAVGCASGSDALLLALTALGIQGGDEVITTPFTFGATAGSIARLGARPVFVDIEPESYNLDPRKLEAAITPRTRAILPVHLFGCAAEMHAIREIAGAHNLPVVEDAAQAIGASYEGKPIGSLGAAGCFSFFPSKNLGGAGDGGMITTHDAELADRLKALRVHGCRKKYKYDMIGINSRLDALQAAILRVKLRHLAEWTEARRRNAARYRTLFAEFGLQKQIALPVEAVDRVHVYNQFVICTRGRDLLREYLAAGGIPTEIYYPSPLHLERAYAYLGHKAGDFPAAEAASREVLALPIFAELTEPQQRAVVERIASFFSSRN
jgi:dTDP-4-amino-4,6-dideoxygalactose transaminase